MTLTEIVGVVLGATSVLLAVRQNPLTFPVSMTATCLLFLVLLDDGLYANAGLQVLFFGLGVHGWYQWSRGRRDDAPLRVTRATPRQWALAAAAFAVLAVAITVLLDRFADSTAPIPDAATTASSLVAQTLVNRKILATWWWWIATDVVRIGLFASRGLWPLAGLSAMFLVLCVLGYRSWRAAADRDAATTLELR